MAQQGKQGVDLGARLAIVVAVLVLLVSAVQLPLGNPIGYFGSTALSLVYVFTIYVPVLAVCVLSYLRLRRS